MNQMMPAKFLCLSTLIAASLWGLPAAHAEGCWDSFAPDQLASVKVRQMNKAQARDLLVYLHGQGEIVLNDAGGRELNDTSEGKPAYANNGHAQFFDAACKVKWPAPSDRLYLNQTIAGVAFRFYANGDKNNKADQPAKKPMRNLDARNAVGIYWLAKALKDNLGVTEFYHAGIGQGKGPPTDQHNEGRAIDLVGVKIGGQVYTVLNDWAQQADRAGNRPVAGKTYAALAYRLQGKGGVAEQLFRFVYDFASTHYCDSKSGRTQIGQTSDILHPDTPSAGLRQDHVAHMHFDISREATSY